MKCEWCGGAIIYRPGNSVEPARTVCMACGREPKGKEEKMDEKTKRCNRCKRDLPATREVFGKRAASPDGLEYSCKDCRKKVGVARRKGIGKPGNRRKLRNKKPDVEGPGPVGVAEGILLDQQLIRAIKRSVAKEIVGIIEERFV